MQTLTRNIQNVQVEGHGFTCHSGLLAIVTSMAEPKAVSRKKGAISKTWMKLFP